MSQSRKRVEIRPATAADILAIYGEPLGPTVKALAAVLDGMVLGVGGIAYHGDRVTIFSRVRPELREFPGAIRRGADAVLKLARGTGMPAFAFADLEEPGSERFLQHLGLEHVATTPFGEMYR